MERDPVEVPLEEKIALCLRAEEGMRRHEVKITEATVRAMREQRVFRSSEGANVTQRFVECGGGIDALAVSDDGRVQNRSYPSAHGGSSGQAGWEFVEGLGLDREAPRVGEEAAALLTAARLPVGNHHDRRRRRADGAAGARVRGPPDRARPRLRHRGRLRGHELPQAGRPRQPALRLRAHEHHRRSDHPARPRHLRLGRRGLARAAPADRRGRRPHRLPRLARDLGADRPRRSAARCAPTTGAACRSSA